jgi:putative hydrolase of the HAD superfamily
VIRALFLDLDNCLAAAAEVGDELYAPAFAAIRAANRGAVQDATLDAAFAETWRTPFDRIAEKYGFTHDMFQAGWAVFCSMEVAQPMRGYGDLPVLGELHAQCFLVTSGFRRLQESKIAALGLAPLCAEVHVDAIDESGRLGKEAIFHRILQRHSFTPDEVLVIGDSAESEIAAGNRLGIRTVQTLRPGVPRTETATFHIGSLHELKVLLDDIG